MEYRALAADPGLTAPASAVDGPQALDGQPAVAGGSTIFRTRPTGARPSRVGRLAIIQPAK